MMTRLMDFHCGQVKVSKALAWLTGTLLPRVKEIIVTYQIGQVKYNIGLVTFKGYQLDWLVSDKSKDPPLDGAHAWK